MDVPETSRPEEEETQADEVVNGEPELVSLGPFVLPQPPPLSQEEARDVGKTAAGRIFGALASTEPSTTQVGKGQNEQRLGFSRVAGSSGERDAWVLLMTRLASRASADLDAEGGQTKTEQQPLVDNRSMTIADSIRDTLYRYILGDFRSRLHIGITWLNEEWYNDRVQMQFTASRRAARREDNDNDDDDEEDEVIVPLHYDRWVIKVLDGILPYVDARDTKILIRFLSEIPELTIPITQRVASLARDPERVNLCVQALLYVIRSI